MDNRPIAGSGAQVSESSFLSKVFLWMAFGLTLSTASALFILVNQPLLRTVANQWIYLGIALFQLGLVIWVNRSIMTMSVGMARSVFAVYSILNGPLFAVILLVYTGSSIVTTFAIAAGTFLFFSLYGLATKRDLTSIGQLAVMGLIGLIIASIVNLFLKSTAMMWIITYVGIAVFVVLIAYQTQQLKALYAAGFDHPDLRRKMDVLGALSLYIALINLFLMLLNLFGRRRD